MRFTKMHGIGNDFVLMFEEELRGVEDVGAFAARLCRRHFGIGADGLLVLGKSTCADAKMIVYNSDGSIAQMCGNGLRCAARKLQRDIYPDKNALSVETGAGVLYAELDGEEVTCDMGAPIFDAARIPVGVPDNRFSIILDDTIWDFFCVSMGNPHAVTFDAYPEREAFLRLGAEAEVHEIFPEKANIEFCRLRDGGIDVRVWERGDGETLACGTGACAVFAAAHEMGMVGDCAQVRLPGGTLVIRRREDGHLLMRGSAEFVCDGEVCE